MKKVKLIIVICCVSFVAVAGDTNFVASFNSVWKTQNASNILEFVSQTVSTNTSPETLFARSIIAIALQEWSHGATNYLEQAMQMISTNSVYSEVGKTNAIKGIRLISNIFAVMVDDDVPQPSWNTNNHTVIFLEMGNEVPFLDELKKISTIETVKP